MSIDLARQPTTRMFDLEELATLVQHGRIRIPHFQRSFRWELRDVVRLFDSIARGYPVGSLLLWERPAPAEQLRIGALVVDGPEDKRAWWVVDGQQRITSLVNALTDEGQQDDRFAVHYDLRRDRFIGSRDADSGSAIPLPDLFDLTRMLPWFQQRSDLGEYVGRANEVTRQLHRFEIPGYIVDQAEIEVLQDIFDRMNNYGRRLSRAEIFSALNAPPEGQRDEAITISRITNRVAVERGFGLVDEDTVLKIILARRGPDVSREIRLEFDRERRHAAEFPDESAEEGYLGGQEAMLRAVMFLQDIIGVPHFSFLPYRYLLVVLSRFLAHHPKPHPRNVERMRRWFWRAALLGPEIFKGSATGATRALCSRIDPMHETGSVDALLAAVSNRPLLIPAITRFRTNEGSTRIQLCALWDLRPRSLVTGETFDHEVLSDALMDQATAIEVAREIIPRRALSAEQRTWAANRLLLPSVDEEAGRTVVEMLSLTKRSARAVWKSHALDAASVRDLLDGRLDEFLARRTGILKSVIESFLARVTGSAFEDTPPLDELDLDEIYGRDDQEMSEGIE